MNVDRHTFSAGLAIAALAVTAVAMCAVDIDGTEGTAAAPRSVVATVGPNTVAPQAAATVDASAEIPVRIESHSGTQPRLDLRQITYTIAGNQRPDDPVTVVYADETGALRTVENVTLPWTIAVVPDLPVNYVTANSRGSQLNCWITDAGGRTVVSHAEYGTFTTCNR